jgi:ubiquinone/menaquinone biosynthesis C-methylase UbiE
MDKEYWNNFYSIHSSDTGLHDPSSFAVFCSDNFFKESQNLVELGSGNGRDAFYFASLNHDVVAIDQSKVAIQFDKKHLDNYSIDFILHDFLTYNYDELSRIDVFYSRFTIHSITEEQEDLLLNKLYDSLSIDGLVCIEVRTIKDKLFGMGEYCGGNTYMTDHKRRFIDAQIFLHKVLLFGYDLLFYTEQDGLSIYKDDNPVLLRIVLKKT